MTKYRAKCLYCDTEFEYQRDSVMYHPKYGRVVQCPECNELIQHNSDTPRSQTNITTMFCKDK